MHPAPSVIVFSTLSGLGFGLLVWLGLGELVVTGWIAFGFFAIAYLLAVGGLISSTLHLGHPERAIKAFSQWRSSWLSREGVCAVAALIVMALYGAGLVFFDARWSLIGWIGAALSLATVFTTGMIYAQLKTVPRWNHFTTPALFLAYCVAGGALLANQWGEAFWLLLFTAILQITVWWRGDQALGQSGTTLASATGLGRMGRVRPFEPPHTGTNYLLREFAYQIGRKHAQKLRIIALLLAFAVPLLIMLFPHPGHFAALIAIVSHLAGVFASRWLFFAEAEHVVGLYYGKRTV